VLEVQHPEHGRRLLTLEPGVGTHDLPRFELGAGAGFTLSASNTRGEPLARQRFELTQVERPGMPANSGQRRVLFADADGVVSAHALAPGAWDLTPQSPPREPANPHSSPVGWRGPTRRLHLEPGEHLRGAPLAIESGSVLIVRAVAPGSAPELDELTPVLRLGSVSSGSPPVSGPHPVTAGVWRFENVPSGRHRVLLGTRGRTDVDVPPDGRAECAVHVSGWLEVTGRVTRAGEPVPRASILVNRRLIALKDSDATVFGNLEMSSNFSQIEADEAGRFSTQVLEGETLWLFASDSTAEFVSEARELVPREGEATHVELTLHPREDVPQAPDLATLIRR